MTIYKVEKWIKDFGQEKWKCLDEKHFSTKEKANKWIDEKVEYDVLFNHYVISDKAYDKIIVRNVTLGVKDLDTRIRYTIYPIKVY